MRVAFTGGRDAKNAPQVQRILNLIVAELNSEDNPAGPIKQVIAGDAAGIDTMVVNYFRGKVRLTVEHAAWLKHDKAAGHIRNGNMLDHEPDLLVAFPGGPGTQNCIKQAELRKINVFKVTQYMLENDTLEEIE